MRSNQVRTTHKTNTNGKQQRKWTGKHIIIGVMLLTTAMACFLYYRHTSAELESARQMRDQAEVKYEALRIEVDKLKNEIERLQSDSVFIENTARHDLGMVKTGDTVIKLDEYGPETRYISGPSSLTGKRKRTYNLTSN